MSVNGIGGGGNNLMVGGGYDLASPKLMCKPAGDGMGESTPKLAESGYDLASPKLAEGGKDIVSWSWGETNSSIDTPAPPSMKPGAYDATGKLINDAPMFDEKF